MGGGTGPGPAGWQPSARHFAGTDGEADVFMRHPGPSEQPCLGLESLLRFPSRGPTRSAPLPPSGALDTGTSRRLFEPWTRHLSPSNPPAATKPGGHLHLLRKLYPRSPGTEKSLGASGGRGGGATTWPHREAGRSPGMTTRAVCAHARVCRGHLRSVQKDAPGNCSPNGGGKGGGDTVVT